MKLTMNKGEATFEAECNNDYFVLGQMVVVFTPKATTSVDPTGLIGLSVTVGIDKLLGQHITRAAPIVYTKGKTKK